MPTWNISILLSFFCLGLFLAGVPTSAADPLLVGNDYNLYGHLYQNDVPEIGGMACCPTAAINSFTYLQNRYPGIYGSKLASNPPTIADVQTIAGPNYMQTNATLGTSDAQVIWGRFLYIEDRAPLQTQYFCQVAMRDGQPLYKGDEIEAPWPLNRPLPGFLHPQDLKGIAVPTWQFLSENLAKGADLGVAITLCDKNGIPLNSGHCLTLHGFAFDDQNHNGLIDPGEGRLSFVDPANTTAVTCNVWQNSDLAYLSGYPYLLLDYRGDQYSRSAFIDSVMAEYPLPQAIPATVPAGSILVLKTSSPYGTLTFGGGVLYALEPQTMWPKAMILETRGVVLETVSTCTLAGDISGTGTLNKMGQGTLFLQGNNSYAGGTRLMEGSVNIVRDENLGAPTGSLMFQGGTLQAGAPLTLLRPVVCQPVEGQDAPFNTFDTGVFASQWHGALTGDGNLLQTGQGSLTLLGDGSDHRGNYLLDRGTLIIANTLGNSSVASKVVIQANGILKGSGPLVKDVDNYGTVNPGASVGTMNVEGWFTQEECGVLELEVASPNRFDKLNVTGILGIATLDGSLKPVLLSGYRPPANTVFPGIITATRGIDKTFATIANNTPILTWQARYSPNQVDLTLTRDYARPSLSLNRTQHAVGAMFNQVADTTRGDLAAVLNTLDNLPTSSAVAAAYQQISPDQASAMPALSLAGSMMQWQSLANRLSYQRWCRGGLPNLAGGRPGSFNLSYNRLAGLMLAYNGADLTGLLSAPRPPADGAGTWSLFMDFVSTFGSQDSTANLTGYNLTIFGFMAGADYRILDDLVLGLGTGYYNTSASYQGWGGDAGINSIPFSAYGAYTPGSFYAMGSLGYTLNLYSLNRNLAFGGLNRTATASPNGNQLNASLETGYDFRVAQFTITPAVSLSYSTAWVDSYTESGAGALNLTVGAQSADSVQTGVGLRLSRPFQSGATLILPQIYAFYQHEFANNSRGLDASLAQAGSTFALQTDSPSRNFALLGAGLAVGLRQNLTLQATYSAEVGRGGYFPQIISAGLRYEF